MNGTAAPLDCNSDIFTHDPEWSLLLAAARACPSFQAAVPDLGAIDWTILLKLASRHGMIPLLYRHLQSSKLQDTTQMPPGVLARLQMQFRVNAARNGQLLEELSGLLRQFEAHGIDAVPYKGPALAAWVYGDLALRACGDLDILLRPGDVLRAKALLLTAGYQPVQQFQTPCQEQRHLQSDCEYNFRRPTDGILVELHWRFRPQFFPLPLDMERLWERTQPAALGGAWAQTLAPEDLLLILCVHGAKHCWERLGWVCDIAALLRAFPALDWEQARAQAQAAGCERVLLLGLALAQELLGAALPSTVPQKMPGAVAALAAEVQRQLIDTAGRNPPARMLFHLRVRDRLRDRVPYVKHHVRRQLQAQIEEWTA